MRYGNYADRGSQAYTAPLPPYLRPDHPAAWSFCQGCCRLIGEFRADGSRALRCLDSGKTGEANKDSAGKLLRTGQNQESSTCLTP